MRHISYSFWTVTILRVVPIYFIFSVSVSMLLYPGGNIYDSAQPGYSLTYNFLSDLGSYKAHSGDINFFSALFFNMGMLSFALVAISFIFSPLLFRSSIVDYRLCICGSIFCITGILFFSSIGLMPADLFLKQHIFAAINGPRWIAIGSLFYLIVLYRTDAERIYLSCISIFFFTAIGYATFQLITRDNAISTIEKLIFQATVQKIVVVIMLASMFIMSYAFASRVKKAASLTDSS